ncbi:MAG: tetratricopeptide repeat protein [Phycisphaeraceae bacterium]|nr:tetratricopeptide repeat protein [Phycisphaeraceae bacterium]
MHRRATLLMSLLAALALVPGRADAAGSDSSLLVEAETTFETLADQSDLDAAQLDEAGAVIERAMRAAPDDGRWVMASAMLTLRRGDSDKAYDIAKKAVKLSPDDAMVQYCFGNAAFAHINDVSFINMGAVSDKGKAAFEKAIELDPTLVQAHAALANFYLYAPGIAGGSVSKAREIASTIATIEGGRVQAALLRMQIEGKEKNWEAFNSAADESVELASEGEQRQAARLQVAMILAFQGDRHAEALGWIRDIHEHEASSGEAYRAGTVSYIEGMCLQETGDVPGAIACYERTLEINPNAQNTRYRLAECYEESGEPALAAEQYQEFADRFKDDDRARTAKKKAKSLQKKSQKKG